MQRINEYLSTKVKNLSNKDKYYIVYPHNDAWTEFNDHQHDDTRFFSSGFLALFLLTKTEAKLLLDKYSDNDVELFEVTEDFADINEYIKKVDGKFSFEDLEEYKVK